MSLVALSFQARPNTGCLIQSHQSRTPSCAQRFVRKVFRHELGFKYTDMVQGWFVAKQYPVAKLKRNCCFCFGLESSCWPTINDADKRRTCVIQFHKPSGLVTSRSQQHDAETVYSYLHTHGLPESESPGWHCVGRLDKSTSGLLLLTNDGRLVHHVTNPHAHVEGGKPIEKTYVARCMGVISEETLQRLREGVDLGGGLGLSGRAGVVLKEHDGRNSTLEITISEGKNRQIRRMLHAVGSGVMALQRVRLGGLYLNAAAADVNTKDISSSSGSDTSQCGSMRLLQDEEVLSGLGYMPCDVEPSSTPRRRYKSRLAGLGKNPGLGKEQSDRDGRNGRRRRGRMSRSSEAKKRGVSRGRN